MPLPFVYQVYKDKTITNSFCRSDLVESIKLQVQNIYIPAFSCFFKPSMKVATLYLQVRRD